MALLDICEVTKTFKDVCALDHVSCSLNKGIYGLIGANGAGKSTLFHILTTSMESTSGEVLYNGCPIRKLKREYRAHIGYMPQNQKGYEQLSAKQFLYYMAALKGMKKAEAAKQIELLAEKVHLQGELHRNMAQYSGGMRQRLLFMQALLGDPDILILDEPTAGLDPYERIAMRNHIFDISHDKTVMIATHVMQDIEYIADEILLLKKGKLLYQGAGDALIERLQGHVHERVVPFDKLEAFQKTYRITRMLRKQEGVRVRYLTDKKEKEFVAADMEDVYLYYMMET